jgi:hypothetical protein
MDWRTVLRRCQSSLLIPPSSAKKKTIMKKKYKEPMMTVVSIGGGHHLLSGSGERLKVTISGYGAGGSSNDGDGFSQEPEE